MKLFAIIAAILLCAIAALSGTASAEEKHNGATYFVVATTTAELPWNAIAYTTWYTVSHKGGFSIKTPHAAVGASNRKRSEAEAKAAAIKDCRAKGGKHCTIATTWQVGCAFASASMSRNVVGVKFAKTDHEAEKACGERYGVCTAAVGNCAVWLRP